MGIDLIVLGIATLIGLYMAANIGANDLANAMGTSIGSGAITLKEAVLISVLANTLGAVLAGKMIFVSEDFEQGYHDFTNFISQIPQDMYYSIILIL